MKERRSSPRLRCRLHCVVRRGRDRVRARVLDVSEGGLCLLSPVELKKGQSLQLDIDVPSHGPAKIEAVVWHVRKIKSKATRRWTWSAGMMLERSDKNFELLLSPTGSDFVATAEATQPAATAAQSTRAEAAPTPEAAASQPANDTDAALDAANELQAFRVRVQMKGAPRTRLLTLTASSEAEARSLATADLGDAWTVSEISEAPQRA